MNEGLSWQEAFEPWTWPSTLAHFHSRKCLFFFSLSYNKFSVPITIHVMLLPMLCPGAQEPGALQVAGHIPNNTTGENMNPTPKSQQPAVSVVLRPNPAHGISSGGFAPPCPKATDPHTAILA